MLRLRSQHRSKRAALKSINEFGQRANALAFVFLIKIGNIEQHGANTRRTSTHDINMEQVAKVDRGVALTACTLKGNLKQTRIFAQTCPLERVRPFAFDTTARQRPRFRRRMSAGRTSSGTVSQRLREAGSRRART